MIDGADSVSIFTKMVTIFINLFLGLMKEPMYKQSGFSELAELFLF
jgi:hypothetical protein